MMSLFIFVFLLLSLTKTLTKLLLSFINVQFNQQGEMRYFHGLLINNNIKGQILQTQHHFILKCINIFLSKLKFSGPEIKVTDVSTAKY